MLLILMLIKVDFLQMYEMILLFYYLFVIILI